MNVRILVPIISTACIAAGGVMTLSWFTGSSAIREAALVLLFTTAFSWSAGPTFLASGIMLAALHRRFTTGGGMEIVIATMATLVLLGGILSLNGLAVSVNPLAVFQVPRVSQPAGLPTIPPLTVLFLVGTTGLVALHRVWGRSALLLGGLILSILGIYFLAVAGFDGKSVLSLLLGVGMILPGFEKLGEISQA